MKSGMMFLPVMTGLVVAGANAAASDGGKLSERLDFGGDFRYRHEIRQREGEGAGHRHRLRARFKLDAGLSRRLNLHFRIGTGGENPTSLNQTLGEGFTTKPIGVDRAYLAWRSGEGGGLWVSAGKMENPFYRPGEQELVWDNDLSPEGLAGGVVAELGAVRSALTSSVFWVRQESGPGGDTFLWASQLLGEVRLHDGWTAWLSGGYQHYTNVAGEAPFYAGEAFGNTLTGGRFASDFRVLELGGEIGSSKLAGIGAGVFADWIVNLAAETQDTGWLVGARLGRADSEGDLQVSYTYRRLEADATLGLFTDSNVGEGTDSFGHEWAAEYRAADEAQLAVMVFRTGSPITAGLNIYRAQFDVMLYF